MVENELNVRLQHAVIGEGSTTTSSIPKKGEIIFNDTLDNFKVGNGNTTYSQLNNFIKTTSGYFYKNSGTSKFSIYIDSILSTINTKKGIVVNLDTITSESPTGTTLSTGELGFIFGRNIFSSLSIGQEFQIIFNGTFPSGYSSLALIFPTYSMGWSNYVIISKGAWDSFYTDYKIIRRDGPPVVNNDYVFLLTITKIAGSPNVFMINTKL